MLVKSSGIVIKNTRYSETSCITKMYTRSHGMLSFILQGVYSKNARIKPSLLQPLQLLELDFYFKENQNLLKVKEAKPLLQLNHMHFEPKRSAVVMVCAEIINKTIREEEKNEELFDFLQTCIHILDESEKNLINFLLYFLLHYSRFQGFFPSNAYSEQTPVFSLYEGVFRQESVTPQYMMQARESELLGKLIACNINQFDQISIPQALRHQMIDHLIDYYKIHVSGFIKLTSYDVLKSMYT